MFAKCCLFQVLLWGCNSRDLTIAMQGCLRCCRVSHQSPAAGPGCVASFVPWLSALHRRFVYLKRHEFPLFRHLNCSLSLDIAKMSVADTQKSPYQGTGKNQEACSLVSLTLLSISANYFNSVMKCKRRWMHYVVEASWKAVPETAHSQEQIPASAQCPSEEEEGHTVPAVVWAMATCQTLQKIPEKQVNTTRKATLMSCLSAGGWEKMLLLVANENVV